MKKIIIAIVIILTFSNVCQSQKTEIIGEPKITIVGNSYKSEPFTVSSGRFINFTITVESDFVGLVGPGCFTVNVRVYMTSSIGTTLVANQNVNVGEGCAKNRMTNNSTSKCPTVEFKGDLIIEKQDSFKYCLVELLQEEAIYQVYLRMKTNIISSAKK